jgi:hypothetical protein
MTGYTVHTGSSIKFSDGWDNIFAKGAKKNPSAAKADTKKTAKAPAKKAATAKKKASPKKRAAR